MANTTTPASGLAANPVRAWHFAALLAGNVALALGPWLVRLADTGPVSAGFWRLFLPLPLFVWLAWRERRGAKNEGTIDKRLIALILAAGVFFALDLAAWHLGIELTRLGNATLFGNAGSVILMVWGLIALRRLPRVGETAAILAALLGAAILLGRSLEMSAATLVGDLFCLLAGLCYAFYLIPAQKARRVLGQWSVLALICLAGSPVLLAIAIGLGEPVWPGTWTPVVALAICSQVIGQGLLVYSLKHFSPLVIGLALLTQPAIAAISGWFAFGETVDGLDVLGMMLVAGALLMAKMSENARA